LSAGRFPSTDATNALRVGAYQIYATRIPDYASVDTTVEALRSLNASPGEISLVNAVLRKFIRKWKYIKLPDDDLNYLSIKYSHPQWLVSRWLERYGKNITEKMLSANNESPPRTYRINILRIAPQDCKSNMRKQGIDFSETVFTEYFELNDKIPVEEFSLFRDGMVSVQDAAFGIPIRALEPSQSAMILEIGSAPGGKTTDIIEKLDGEVKNLFAVDISYSRIRFILENVERLGHPVPNIIVADGKSAPFEAGTFDSIFIDAPCSSLGIIRRHPEIRWHKKPDDILTMAKMQTELIHSAVNLLKSNGTLVFTTCTTEPEENQNAVQTITKSGMKIIPIPDVPSQFLESNGTMAITYPYRDNMDGSFTVRAKKLGSC